MLYCCCLCLSDQRLWRHRLPALANLPAGSAEGSSATTRTLDPRRARAAAQSMMQLHPPSSLPEPMPPCPPFTASPPPAGPPVVVATPPVVLPLCRVFRTLAARLAARPRNPPPLGRGTTRVCRRRCRRQGQHQRSFAHRCCRCCAWDPPPVTAVKGVDRPLCVTITPRGSSLTSVVLALPRSQDPPQSDPSYAVVAPQSVVGGNPCRPLLSPSPLPQLLSPPPNIEADCCVVVVASWIDVAAGG